MAEIEREEQQFATAPCALRATAPIGADVQQSARPRTSDRPLQFELIPQVCTIADVCHFLQVSERQFHYLMARKKLPLAEVDIDSTRRFTGESLARTIRLLRRT